MDELAHAVGIDDENFVEIIVKIFENFSDLIGFKKT